MTSRDWGSPPDREPVADGVLTAISRAEGIDETELEPPLGSVVDLDALEQLAESATGPFDVEFEYRDWSVQVRVGCSIEVSLSPLGGDRYECVCHSCGTRELMDGLREAQASFNDHAADGCEVVIRNFTSPTAPVTVDSAVDDPSGEPSSAED